MGRLSVVIALSALAALAAPADAALLRNGSFTAVANGMPKGWRLEAWARDLSTVRVEPAADGSGAVQIVNLEPNDARICQTIAVAAGAEYRISARVKTENVGLATAGALIAIEPRIADSTDVKGSQDWQYLEVRARSDERTSWEVCLRLGSYANLNTGAAWFSDVRVDLLTGPSAPTEPSRPAAAAARFVEALLRAPWTQALLPLAAGVVLAFGLGIFGRRGR
ncbi:MAG: hypothetical protein B6D46_08530 [Polyangiaceae bacterium UTPRO1]|jgi:hypothetical protein|nr:hypothetical protein [Myxococcales bacterium]OQY66991.1 MAG: hypothetical protein B6D46_08530 [Polyangiaceae bacterium UTPRO1]